MHYYIIHFKFIRSYNNNKAIIIISYNNNIIIIIIIFISIMQILQIFNYVIISTKLMILFMYPVYFELDQIVIC